MVDSFSAFARKLTNVEQGLTGAKGKAILKRIGEAGAKDATSVITSRIGDTSMSHWNRKNPIDLTLRAKNLRDTSVEVAPANKALGPSRVLNDGRKSYAKGDRRLTGKFSKKTGKALSRKVKRATGGIAHGKHTWDDGKKLVEERTPKRMQDEFHKLLKSQFGG